MGDEGFEVGGGGSRARAGPVYTHPPPQKKRRTVRERKTNVRAVEPRQPPFVFRLLTAAAAWELLSCLLPQWRPLFDAWLDHVMPWAIRREGGRWRGAMVGYPPPPADAQGCDLLVWNHGIRNVEGRADHQGIGFSRVSQCT
jgi:hypothetical protein